jgi:ribosome maturation factor RimP
MDLKIIEQIFEPYLEENGLYLYDVEFVKEFGYNILRISIDKDGGIDIDDLAKANEYISVVIEKYDADLGEYMLEVSSPGAEKKLRNIDEIVDSIGLYVHIEIPNNIYEGYLESVVDDTICVKINAKGRFKRVNIKYDEISLIRLAVKI